MRSGKRNKDHEPNSTSAISVFVVRTVCLSLAITGIGFAAGSDAVAQRSVAITVDDLPANSSRGDVAVWRYITDGLVSTLRRERVPAIGFVNEGKLFPGGDLDTARVVLLEQWLDAGLELGNHTFSHRDLLRVPVQEFEQDVIRGERITAALLAKRGQRLRFFRHPFLHTGPNLAVRREFESFLKRRGYRVAPVTVDNSDYMFAAVYDRALDAGDEARVRAVGAEYILYMTTMFAYYEKQSKALLGYELPQTLLLHASRLNAEYLDDLIVMLRRRGYDFVSLEKALADPAYARPDRYAGEKGITWLRRWALTAGKRASSFPPGPDVPKDIIMAWEN